ncbi:MAG: MarR family winged helix-turn-helix transcriptional regulator [Aureispira sp.]
MDANTKLDELYIFLIERTFRSMRRYSNSEFAKFGYDISVEQWIVLKQVSENPKNTQRQISTATNKDPASVTRILDLLEKRGLIERTTGVDRRSFGILLTTEGEELVAQILPKAFKIREKGIKGFTEEEEKQLVGLLHRVYDNFTI